MRRPVSSQYPISQGYGANPTRNLPAHHETIRTYGNYQPFGHIGIDYACPLRTPVYAPAGGVIDHADWGYNAPAWVTNKWMMTANDRATGIGVFIDHGNGVGSLLAHLSRTLRNAGQRVKAGDLIGYSGSTGRSGGPHLHLSLVRLPAPNDGVMYGRLDPTTILTLSESIDPITEGFLMALNDSQQLELLANTRKALSEATNAKVAARQAVKKLDAVLYQLTDIPLPGGGTTEARMKFKWQADELHQIKEYVREAVALLNAGNTAEQETAE